VAELRRLGLAPVGGEEGVVVTTSRSAVPAGWASCAPIIVGQDGPERRMVTVESRHGTVRATLTPAGRGTRVDVAADFTGTYRNPITTYRREEPCRSTGVLESRLLAAAAGSPAS
jgi:hypothetical protein